MTTIHQDPTKIAISEVQTPTFGVTNQVFSVHKAVLNNGAPLIARIDNTREPGAFFVYFPLLDEDYYFVVVIRPTDNGLAVSVVYIEANVRVYLMISSPIYTPEEITKKVELLPTSVHKKGEKISLSSRVYTKNQWLFEPGQDIPDGIDHKILHLLNQLEHVRTNIAQLANECNICLCICYEGYKDWMGGWNADKETIKRISALEAEIDLDLYARGPDLP
jgi:hypothetical protein